MKGIRLYLSKLISRSSSWSNKYSMMESGFHNLPDDLVDLTLLYLSYPELLKIESLTKKILLRDIFWKSYLRNIQDQDKDRNKDILEYRQECQHLFVSSLIEDEAFFYLGQLCLPLNDKDYELLKQQPTAQIHQFALGSLISSREDLILPLKEKLIDSHLKSLLYLHQGDRKNFEKICYDLPYQKSSFKHAFYYTREMINHVIAFKIYDSNKILPLLLRFVYIHDDHLIILEWFLEKYGSKIPLKHLRRSAKQLQDHVRKHNHGREFLTREYPAKIPELIGLSKKNRFPILKELRINAASRIIDRYINK